MHNVPQSTERGAAYAGAGGCEKAGGDWRFGTRGGDDVDRGEAAAAQEGLEVLP